MAMAITGHNRRGPVEIICSVDGCSGAFALFDLDDQIVDGADIGPSFVLNGRTDQIDGAVASRAHARDIDFNTQDGLTRHRGG